MAFGWCDLCFLHKITQEVICDLTDGIFSSVRSVKSVCNPSQRDSETASERASVISAVCFLSYIRHCFVVNTDRLRTFYNPLAGNITSFRRDEGSTLLRHILQVHAVEKWRETRDREHVIWFWTHWNIKPATRCSICRLCSPIINRFGH